MTNTQLITLILTFLGIGIGGITSTHLTLRNSLSEFKDVIETKLNSNDEIYKNEIKSLLVKIDSNGKVIDANQKVILAILKK